MAFILQEDKQRLAPLIKAVLNTYGLKGTLSIRHHSTLVLTIKSGKINFIKNFIDTADNLSSPVITYLQVNPYSYQNYFTGIALSAVTDLIKIMNKGNWDNSDLQTDYFDIGWYIDIRIGTYLKPYILQ